MDHKHCHEDGPLDLWRARLSPFKATEFGSNFATVERSVVSARSWPRPEIACYTGKLPLDEIRSRSEARRLARRRAPIIAAESTSCLASSPSPKQSNPRARHLSQRGGFDAAQKARVRLPRTTPSDKSLGRVDDGAAGNLIRRV